MYKEKNYDFNKNLNDGETQEEIISYIMLSYLDRHKDVKNVELGHTIKESGKSLKAYDIALNVEKNNGSKKEILYECKSEENPTGNLYLCYKKWNKPGGIVTSESNYYLFQFRKTYEIYMIKTIDLKYIIDNNLDFDCFRFHNTQGDNNNWAFILPISELDKHNIGYRHIKYTDLDIEDGKIIAKK